MAELDALRTEILGLSAKKIQTKVRSHVARKKYVMLQHFATQLQAVCRGTYIFIYIILHTNTISSPMKLALRRERVTSILQLSKVQSQDGGMKLCVERQLH